MNPQKASEFLFDGTDIVLSDVNYNPNLHVQRNPRNEKLLNINIPLDGMEYFTLTDRDGNEVKLPVEKTLAITGTVISPAEAIRLQFADRKIAEKNKATADKGGKRVLKTSAAARRDRKANAAKKAAEKANEENLINWDGISFADIRAVVTAEVTNPTSDAALSVKAKALASELASGKASMKALRSAIDNLGICISGTEQTTLASLTDAVLVGMSDERRAEIRANAITEATKHYRAKLDDYRNQLAAREKKSADKKAEKSEAQTAPQTAPEVAEVVELTEQSDDAAIESIES